jgi:phage shock protein PspC (stress-responsive transcriptional regulator)
MNEQPKKNKKTNERTENQVGPRGPLLRSKDNRKIWGVAGGLAEHVGFDPTLVRVFFVITLFFGGAGLLAYLVLAVALPEDDGTGEPVPGSVWGRLGKVLLVCVLIAAAIGLAGALAAVSAWVAATGHGTVIAVAVIVLGLGLVAAAFAGDVRRRLIPWLVASALVVGLPAGAVAAADIHIDSSIGKRTYTPTTVADVPASGYRLGTGQLVVDLRSLPWAKGRTIPVSAHLGIGQMIVSVPSNVCIVADASAKGGDLMVGGQVSNGIDPDVDMGTPLTDAPRLRLNADLQFGQMIVTDQAPDDIDTHGVDYDHHQVEESTQRQACGR